MGFLNWLQTNSFSNWVLSTGWVYPWTIAFHSIGMGFLVGIIAMIGIRVIGFGSYSVAPLARFLMVVRIAFIVNVLTGLTMFVIEAEQFFFSPTFRIKMIFVALGVVSGWLLSTRIFGDKAQWDGTGDAPQSAKLIAGITLACWTGAIIAGRLTAYLP